MGNTLNTTTIAIGEVLSSLEKVLESSSKAKALVNALGWELPPGLEDIGLASIDLTAFLEKFRIVTESSEEEWESELLMAGRIADLGLALNSLVGEINHLAQELPAQLDEYGDYVSRTNIHKELPKRMSDLLITGYLSKKSDLLFSVLHLLNIVEFRHFEANLKNYQVQHVRAIVHYNHLNSFISYPSQHLQKTYGWSTPEFSSLDLLTRIGEVLRAIGATVRMQSMDPRAEKALVGKSAYDTTNNPAPQMFIHLYEDLGEIAGLMLGLTVFGARPTLEGASDGGIGVLPIVRGYAEGEIPLYAFDDTVFEFSGDADLLRRIALIMRPNFPLQVQTAGSLGDLVDGRFALGIRHGQAGVEPKSLVSFPGGSRLSMQQFTLMGGVDKASEGTNESFMELGLWGCQVIISLSEADGFLSDTISREQIEVPFDFVLGWSSSKGIYIHGSTGLSVTIPLYINLGPIFLQALHLALDTKDEGFDVEASINGNLTIGPLAVTMSRLGMEVQVSFGKGNLGLFGLSPSFNPPTAIGLSVNAEGITGGGFLTIDPPNYAGVMELSFQNEIDLAAFGLITTRLPDGKDGFSLVIQILAEFQPVQLGLGFALIGVGGLIGINRQINETNLRDAIKNHTFDLFPQNPITDAVRLLGTIESVLPAKEGFHVFGPMVKIYWGGSVKLVEFEVGVFIEIGGPTRVALIGRAWSILPSEETQLLVLNVDVFGIIDFGDERIALDAFLFDSKILSFPLDGQMALRADWSEGEENFALSVGGFHPRFQAIPPGFPTLRRLMVSVGSGNPRLTLSMYLAITTNTLQVGAQLDLWAKKAGFTITGGASFDALIVFSPFSFLVILNIWVNVKRGWVELGVSLELELSGPNPIIAVGFAKFKVGWFTKRVRFRKEFGDRIDEPLPVVSPLAVLKAELENPHSIRFKLPDWASANLIFTQAAESRIDPVAEIIIDQDAVPLDLTMDRFGGGTPPPGEKKLNITAGLGEGEEHPTTSLFAPNQFKNWTEKQRLSAKPFEKFKSGIRMSGDWVIPEDDIEERCIGFETVVRESTDYRAAFPAHAIEAALDRFTCVWQPQEASLMENWSMFGAGNYFRPLRKTTDTLHPNYIRVVETAFTLVGDEIENGQSRRLDVDSRVVGDMTYAEALELTEQFKGFDVNVRNVVEVESVVL